MLRTLLRSVGDPARAWSAIAARPLPGWPAIVVRLVALALVPAVAWALGLALGLPNPWVGAEEARGSPRLLLHGGAVTALAAFVAVAALAGALRLIAPLFGGRRDFRAAAVLAVGASAVPLLTAVTLALPLLMLAVVVAGLQALASLGAGAVPLLGVPVRESAACAVASAAASAVIGIAVGAVASAAGLI